MVRLRLGSNYQVCSRSKDYTRWVEESLTRNEDMKSSVYEEL